MLFDLDQNTRKKTWNYLTDQLEEFYANTEENRVAIYPERGQVQQQVEKSFNIPRHVKNAIDQVLEGMTRYAVHTPHPGYYGMFNPRANFPSILADAITAVFNPQLAAWGHAPYAVEIEHMLIRVFGEKFGYKKGNIDGVFTSGGQEANLTAVLCALNSKFPAFSKDGVQSIVGKPIIYCSTSSHHATVKAAKVCGLGSGSIQYVDVDDQQRMIITDLEEKIKLDLERGNKPFMIVATLGTTGVGAIDPINPISELARKYNLWLHADAAYGGAVKLSYQYGNILDGIEKSDSITFDAHKWLSVPMGASMFITSHPFILGKTFSIKSDYMPEEEDERDRLSSYTHSIQWSRRFIGLKVYMPLLVFGWEGFDKTISHQIKMGNLLKYELQKHGWQLYNDTELPIACFNDPAYEKDEDFSTYIYESFLETGEAWINKYPVGDKHTLRACITNYATEERHIHNLINQLNAKRIAYSKPYKTKRDSKLKHQYSTQNSSI